MTPSTACKRSNLIFFLKIFTSNGSLFLSTIVPLCTSLKSFDFNNHNTKTNPLQVFRKVLKSKNKMIKVTAKKVYVAMSGGVDSSVAAALLKKKGYEVTGVFFKPWQPDKGLAFCNWEKDRKDAIAVAEVLGIPFKTWDFSKEYKNKVGVYMIEAYRQGITPNPDVMCNKEIKFGLFLKKALKEGADFIATGHYVRLKATSYPEPQQAGYGAGKRQATSQKKNTQTDGLKPKTYSLFQAKDKNKDQSYFLWTLTQEQLKHCLFPVGDYAKPEV